MEETFLDIAGKTDLLSYSIHLISVEVVNERPYPVPLHYRETLEKEITELLRLGLIKNINSNYCWPMVLIKKKDASLRLCIDFRKLNALTVPDAHPIPNIEDLLSVVSNAKVFFSKCDLTKGY